MHFFSLGEEDAYRTLVMLLMAASGMWPHCHPSATVQAVLQDPEFAAMRFDFKTLVQHHTAAVLRGLLA